MTISRRDFLLTIGIASTGGLASLRAQAESADLLLYNGKVVTVDDAFSIREAIVVKEGRIAAVGGNELRSRYTAARAIDLRGRTVIPGFHDTHIHLAGHSRRYINLTDTVSLEQLKQQGQLTPGLKRVHARLPTSARKPDATDAGMGAG